MFSRNKDDTLDRVKEKAQQDVENERQKLEAERQRLEEERAKLEKLRDELDAREDELENLEDQLEDLEDELEGHEDEIEDAESVKDILNVMTEGIPNLVRGISDAVYTPEAMEASAKSLATYYKTLIDAGMEKSMAENLTMVQATQMNKLVAGRGVRHLRPHPRTVPPPRSRPNPHPNPNPRPHHHETSSDED